LKNGDGVKRLSFGSETPVQKFTASSVGLGGAQKGPEKAVRQPKTKENGRNMDS